MEAFEHQHTSVVMESDTLTIVTSQDEELSRQGGLQSRKGSLLVTTETELAVTETDTNHLTIKKTHQGRDSIQLQYGAYQALLPVEQDTDCGDSRVVTLLQKALIYRSENPEKWEQRQEESERWLRESYGIYGEDKFFVEYYRRLDERVAEKKKLKQLRRLEPPKLVIEIVYNRPEHITSRNSSSVKTYESLSATGISVIDKNEGFFDKLKSDKSEERGDEPELLIRVVKGKNLLNRLPKEEEKYDDCRVKFTFVEGEKRGDKIKTEYVYLNRKGTTRWDHVLVIKGYTVEQLSKSHVHFEVFGKNDERKDLIGQTFLCGTKGKIQVSGSDIRGPTAEEAEPWKKALGNPGKSCKATIDMLSQGSFSGKTIGSLMRHELKAGKFKGGIRGAVKRQKHKPPDNDT